MNTVMRSILITTCLSFVFCGCMSIHNNKSSKIQIIPIFEPKNNLESNIFRSYSYVAQLNNNISNVQIYVQSSYSKEFEKILNEIKSRYKHDYESIYPESEIPGIVYSIFYSRSDNIWMVDLVFVGEYQENGAYVPQDGLTYYYRADLRFESVRSNRY